MTGIASQLADKGSGKQDVKEFEEGVKNIVDVVDNNIKHGVDKSLWTAMVNAFAVAQELKTTKVVYTYSDSHHISSIFF